MHYGTKFNTEKRSLSSVGEILGSKASLTALKARHMRRNKSEEPNCVLLSSRTNIARVQSDLAGTYRLMVASSDGESIRPSSSPVMNDNLAFRIRSLRVGNPSSKHLVRQSSLWFHERSANEVVWEIK